MTAAIKISMQSTHRLLAFANALTRKSQPGKFRAKLVEASGSSSTTLDAAVTAILALMVIVLIVELRAVVAILSSRREPLLHESRTCQSMSRFFRRRARR